MQDNAFVFKSDIAGYYASIDHGRLLSMLEPVVRDLRVRDLLSQWLGHVVDDGGTYTQVTRGISLGCALSPLIGAVYLSPLDAAMEATGLFYRRFMDDWVVLAPTRWKLRRAIRDCNQVLADLLVAQHPDKTFIGRTSRGFDFLGYHVRPGEVRVAEVTIDRMLERACRLYEQHDDFGRVGAYVKRWERWAESGVEVSW